MIKHCSVLLFLVALAAPNLVAQQDPAAFSLQTALSTAVDAPAPTAGGAYTTSGATPSPTISPLYHDAQDRIVVQSDAAGNYGMRYDGNATDYAEWVDAFGNRTRMTKTGAGMPVELKHEFMQRPVWYERFANDAAGGMLLSSVDGGESTLEQRAGQFGVKVGFPDWLRITFPKAVTIDEVRIVTLQDAKQQGIRPLLASEAGGPTQFSLYGITDYEVQYLTPTGQWAGIPGCYVTYNRDVARAFKFKPISTGAIRLLIKGGIGGYSRVVEVEAFEESTHRNVALASQGASATASSVASAAYSPLSVIDADETGKSWDTNGGWKDATPDVATAPAAMTTADIGNNYAQTTYTSPFAKVVRTTNNNPRPTRVPQYQSFLLEKADVTYAGGSHTFSASANMTGNGIEYWDNAGGSRIEYFDSNKRMFYVSDWCDGYGRRPVVRVNRDAQGRPRDVYLGGDLGILQFGYDTQGWAYTRLINRTSNSDIFRMGRRDKVGVSSTTPMTYAQLLGLTTGYAGKYGPIIEWHDSISAVPNIVCNIQNAPYALLRNVTTGYPSGEAARYVIYPFAPEQNPMTNIRVEYDATTIYLYVPSMNAGSMILQNDMRAFHFPRSAGSTASNATTVPDSRVAVDSSSNRERWRDRAEPFKAKMSRIFGKVTVFGSTLVAKTRGLILGGERRSGAGGSGGAQWDDPAVHTFTENIDVPTGGPNLPFNPWGWGNTPFTQWPGTTPPSQGPTEPPNVNNPPGVAEPCTDTGNAQQGHANPTDSWAPGAGSSSSNNCPPVTGPQPANCPKLDSKPGSDLLNRQVEWAKSFGDMVRKNTRYPNCYKFLRDPGHYHPVLIGSDGLLHRYNHSYLFGHGYTREGKPGKPDANLANLDVTDPAKQNEIWDKTQYCDGTDAGHPGCTQPNGCGAAAVARGSSNWVYICRDGFGAYANVNTPTPQSGGIEMVWTLLHEYLHNMGLPESFPTDADPLKYPQSGMIQDALKEACKDATVDAVGTNVPPH